MTNTIESARELVMSRVYRAPRDLVLKMWSDPAMITNWWGPYGFSTTTHEMDFRPGGVWRSTMHGPDGTDYPNFVRYVATGPDQIAYRHGGEDDSVHFDVTVDFVELSPNKTKMDFRMVFANANERERIVNEYGADKGLVETTTRLDTFLADTMSVQDPFLLCISLPSDTEIRMVRSLRAPREVVFEAFTSAEWLPNWLGPRKYKCTECTYDARVGGKWRMVHAGPDGDVWTFGGEVLEFTPPERLVSTFLMEGFSDLIETSTTVFDESDGITKVTILSSYESKEHRDGMLESGMDVGMTEGYERLDEILAERG